MNWHEYLQNPEALKSMYGQVPAMRSARLMKVALHEDGPTAILSLALTQYPPNPPPRWARAGFNAASLQLRFFSLEHFQLKGWQVNNIVEIEMQKIGDSIEFAAKSESITLLIKCGFIEVAGITGYLRIGVSSIGS